MNTSSPGKHPTDVEIKVLAHAYWEQEKLFPAEHYWLRAEADLNHHYGVKSAKAVSG